jgi:hypothetical protein
MQFFRSTLRSVYVPLDQGARAVLHLLSGAWVLGFPAREAAFQAEPYLLSFDSEVNELERLCPRAVHNQHIQCALLLASLATGDGHAAAEAAKQKKA